MSKLPIEESNFCKKKKNKGYTETKPTENKMASYEQTLASLVSQLALSFDGAILGVSFAYAAVRSILRFTSNSKALSKIRDAPSVRVADLRSILDVDSQPSDQSHTQDHDVSQIQKLVFVRGHVETKSAVDGSWKSLRGPNVLVSHESGDKAVVLQRTQTCVYNEWKGLFGLTYDLRGILSRSWREQESSSLRMVPFVLVQDRSWPQSDFLAINLDGSRHTLPLMTVYHNLQPIDASPYTFFQAFFGFEYPVGMLDEEKILPVGKDISAVGTCSCKDGVPEIKSCKDLPYFLSDMTKDEMVADLAFKTKILFWSGVVLGSISIGILGYAIKRNWNKWKEWRRQRQLQEASRETSDGDPYPVDTDDDTGDVPDGELCVICLMRRRRSAFIPCGHLVCCQQCAISVEREVSPKCPLCRQGVRDSIRIFES